MSRLILAENGIAKLPIVLPENAEECLQTAANELENYLKRITGAVFEQKTGAENGIVLKIDLGLDEEEFTLKSDGNGLVIAGGTARGTLYGVYGLLEDILGVRFFTVDTTVIPKQDTLVLEDLNYTDKPALEFRQLDYPRALYPEWKARNRVNGVGKAPMRRDETAMFGGQKTYALFVHTFNTLVPPEKYMDEHPEYYSMISGERIKERPQLCLTNPEVLAIAIENVKKTLREHPEASLISVSQNDWYNPCECPECAKVDAEEGSHAGTLIRFVNAVAEAIEPEFPDIVVDTLAYQYTRTPPKVTKPRSNVCVRLCSIECCFAHPLESCDVIPLKYFREHSGEATFQDDLIGWGKICDRVYIWDYVTDFQNYWMPFPNFHVLGPNMKFFVKNGVRGVYEEGTYQTVSPDLYELRSWLMAKLLWNPDFDVENGIREFTDAVYGAAAPEVREYIRLMADHLAETGAHMCIYEQPTADFLQGGVLEKARALIRKALSKELDLKARIYTEMVDLSLEFTEVGRDILTGAVDTERIDRMMEKAALLGITTISEGTPWNKAYNAMLHGYLYRPGK